jgi:hypothetical protein
MIFSEDTFSRFRNLEGEIFDAFFLFHCANVKDNMSYGDWAKNTLGADRITVPNNSCITSFEIEDPERVTVFLLTWGKFL